MNAVQFSTSAANPATIIRAIPLMDEDAQNAVARILIAASHKLAWLKDALADAVNQQQDDQAAEDAWLEREEERDRYLRGLY
jgi:hypothetical protein